VSEGAVYVFGVVDARDAGAMPVRVVERGGLAALVGDAETSAATAARAVRRHWQVLEDAAAKATVLPLRFGTVMDGDDAVRDLLESNGDALRALLDDLTGRVQITVKGTYVEDGLMRAVVEGSPPVAALRERLRRLPDDAGYYERIRLGELVAAEVDRRREHDTAQALDKLDPVAAGVRVEAAKAPDAAFNLAFLVERERMSAFDAAVGELVAACGDRITVRCVGPLAPYSFADAELAAGAA
jgi:hypothetical protein